ncbi:hypothetical protein HZY62_21175 [Maribacter polysiphoniae]|uniref:Uncharacterized protein n=1 Tax=Maribacter polysiphoniae TaxID=429344 RepID=A0A316DFX1_9FLAO|nr:hypothetical protein [Maribacter polysiphoniae]MBD1263115.1 hypothetical protein [Maribacter polysiphoniae]PWK16994.1 hypothetical protein LX92_04478 [Maribacter polysiphoniae]
MKKSFLKNVLLTIILIGSIGACEKSAVSENLEASEMNIIDIPDFENPEAMWDRSNKLLYQEAYDRFISKTTLINGLYSYDLESGSEIGISEPIFDYIKENIAVLNSFVEQDKGIVIEINDELIYSNFTVKKIIENDLTAFGDIPQQPENLQTMDLSVVLSRMQKSFSQSWTNSNNNLGDHYSWTSSAYDRTDNTTFAGQSVTIHVASSTSVYSTNNPNNSFVEQREDVWGTTHYFNIRNNQGMTLMSMKVEGDAQATAVRFELLYGN